MKLTDEVKKQGAYGTISTSEQHGKRGRQIRYKLVCVSILIVALVGGAASLAMFEKLKGHEISRTPSGIAPKDLSGEPPIPGISSLDRAYNLFRGKFFDKTYSRAIGDFSYPTNPTGANLIALGSKVFVVPSGVNVILDTSCQDRTRNIQSSQTASVSEMKGTSKDLSFGYDATTTVDVSVPVEGAEVGASRDIRTALMFGNTNSLTESRSWKQSKYSYDATAVQEARVYQSFTNWKSRLDLKFNYDRTFLSRLKETGAVSNQYDRNKKVFKFFDDYGSHVIERAVFGARCSQRSFFRAGYSSNSFSRVQNTITSRSAELFGLKFGSDKSKSTVYHEESSQGTSYAVTATRCEGMVENNACDPSVKQSFEPTLLQGKPLAIWDLCESMDEVSARKNLLESTKDLVQAATNCANTRCGSGKGVCRLSENFWSLVQVGGWDGKFRDQYFDSSCICKSGSSPTCGAPTIHNGECIADGQNRMLNEAPDKHLSNGATDQTQDMTIEKCRRVCAGMGWSKAGVEAGVTCFCGNRFSRDPIYSTGCKTRCGGDSSQICGGSWAMNMYDADILVPGIIVVGCYADSWDRILSAKQVQDSQMTINYCKSFCKGYYYFGVEGRDQCFCSNSIKSGAVASANCNWSCKGNFRQVCGGDWRINIFRYA